MGTPDRHKIYSPSRQHDYQITRLPKFGRKTKLRLNPDRIPDLHWNLSTTLNTTPTLTTQQSLIQTSIVSV